MPSLVSMRNNFNLKSHDTRIMPIKRFSLHIQEKDELDLRPVFTEDGVTYVYIKVRKINQRRDAKLVSYSTIALKPFVRYWG
jgi:hypothetical protein